MKINVITPAQAQAAYDNMSPPEDEHTIDRSEAISTLTEMLIAALNESEVREILSEVMTLGWSDKLGTPLDDLSNEELADMYNEHSGDEPVEVVS
jgi:predicted HAD superfamily phosphohydrolase